MAFAVQEPLSSVGEGLSASQPPGIQKTTVSSSDAQWALKDLIVLASVQR